MKISLANLDRIMDICTKKEIDLILYIGQFQDDYGVIKGIHHKEVLQNTCMSKSTFYKLLYALEEKQIIEINYINEHSFWEVKILDNVFLTQEDYKKGYIKLNYAIFHTKEFKNMTKSEKLIIIHLIKINDFRREKIKITLKKMAEWTGKSMRSVKKFINTLSYVLKIVKQGNICLIDCLVGFSTRQISEADVRNAHMVNYKLKKAKCEASAKDIKDVCVLLKQYAEVGAEKIFNIIDDTINSFGTVIPAYINKMINVLKN